MGFQKPQGVSALAGIDDLDAWSARQAELLVSGSLEQIDREAIAASLSETVKGRKSAARKLVRRVLGRVLLCETTRVAPPRGRWLAETTSALQELRDIATPSLLADLRAELPRIYEGAAHEAVIEMADLGYAVEMPAQCPFSWEDIFGGGGRLPY